MTAPEPVPAGTAVCTVAPVESTVDVAVVGGGIVGSLLAAEILRRAPGASVTVLDRDLAGSGASRHSAGLHFPRGATPRVRAMTAASHEFYARLRRDDPALPIRPVALTVLARDAAEPARAYLPLARLTSAPGAVEVPGPGGPVRVPGGAGVWHGEGCHHTDVAALVTTLAARLRRRVRWREGVAVTGIDPGDTGVVLRLGTGETLGATAVVLAPGPWVHAPPWRRLTRPLGVRVKLVVALHLDVPATEHDRLVVLQEPDAFLLPLPQRGHWLFSYTSDRWDVHPDELTGGLTAASLAEGRAVLARYAPHLAALIAGGRVFCDAYSPDREPLVRAVDPARRVVFAGAANGSGYRLAPAIAAEAADLLGLRPAGPVHPAISRPDPRARRVRT